MQKCFVTTPIYYVTAAPHLGSLYSTVLADVIARYAQIQGKKRFLLTGTDEHGQKVAQAAEKAGLSPQKFVDSFIDAYKKTWHQYEINYDYFIRTTDKAHVEAVQTWLGTLLTTGDIYKAFYEGWYCIHCETFVTEKDTDVAHARNNDTPLCPSCARPTHIIAEETYFFKLSKYQDALLAFYEQHPDFVTPKERLHEVINFVKGGLKDLSISRTTVKWGIPFPNDSQHTTYVWADALNNYITAIGYGQQGREKEFALWWPADVQVMGKDILRFHAIYWPAFLMASGLQLPKKLLVHGWIKVNQQKMSKSLGNVVNPQDIYDAYGADAVRYYLVRHMAINQDAEFSIEDLESRISSDLANDLGNLLNRLVALAEKNDALLIPAPTLWPEPCMQLRDDGFAMLEEYAEHMDACMFHLALAAVWKYINAVNAFFHAHEPWKLAKTDRAAFVQILSATAHSLRMLATVVWPVMPEKMNALLESLGHPLKGGAPMLEAVSLNNWNQTFILKKIPTLFEKPIEREKTMTEVPALKEPNYITIQDLTKVELVVGTIEACEAVAASDKLVKMQVNFGEKGARQILAGIRKSYAPEQLIGKQGIFVFNLKPRAMMGMESQGMMLVAQAEDGTVKMATVAATVPSGTQLR